MRMMMRNARTKLGSFTPEQDVNLEGHIEYSSKDFSDFSDCELEAMVDKYRDSPTLKSKAYRLELAHRKLAQWQKENE